MIFNPTYLRYGLRLAIGCLVVTLLCDALHLQNGYWATFSVLGCIFPNVGQTLKRSKQRMIGTFIGMIVAILVAHLFKNQWLYIDLLIPACIFLTVYLKAFNYSYYALFNTVIAVLLVCLLVPGDWQVAYIRMEMTLLGTAIAVLITYFVLPARASMHLPEQLAQVRLDLKNYYLSIAAAFDHEKFTGNNQIAAFNSLQKTMATLQESLHESFIKKTPAEAIDKKNNYQHLEKIYQLLILLDTEMPGKIQNQHLQPLIDPIRQILSETSDCFTNPPAEANRLPEQIQTLIESIQSMRVAGAKDTRIPVATFSEHIQLNTMLQQLVLLARTIQQMKPSMETQAS